MVEDAPDLEEAITKAKKLISKENITLNGFNNIKVIEDDAFHYLDEAYNSGERFDVVILDPPAFTKAKDTIKQAYLGY